MTLRSYLWGMRVSTAVSLAAWVLVLRSVNPAQSGPVGHGLFYVSAFLLLSGVFILLLTWLRRRASESGEVEFAYIAASFRQGILLGLLAVVILFMQGMRVLTWWDGLLVVAFVLLVELHFLTRK